MRKALIIFLLLFGSISASFSQNKYVIKARTTDVAIKQFETNKWSEWSDWEKVNVLAIFDFEKGRITIYSQQTQIYDLAKDRGKSTNEDGDEIYSWLCVNEDGVQCILEYWKRLSENGDSYNQLYVNFSNIKFVYNFYTID